MSSGEHQSSVLNYDVYTSGKYYVVMGACSPATSNIVIQGESLSMNPYGHLSGRLFGLSMFTRVLVVVYLVLCLFWFYRIFRYYHELLSIHVFISLVLFVFTCSSALSAYKYSSINLQGVESSFISTCTLVAETLSHTLLRCLLLLISKGLGISIPSLGSSFWMVLLLCCCYFCNSLAYTYSMDHSTIVYTENLSTNPFSYTSFLIDAAFAYWALDNLFFTIDELRKNKQTSKLQIFLTLRFYLFILLFLITAYNVVFSYMMNEQIIQDIWKWQWVFSDGVWDCLYLFVISLILVFLFLLFLVIVFVGSR